MCYSMNRILIQLILKNERIDFFEIWLLLFSGNIFLCTHCIYLKSSFSMNLTFFLVFSFCCCVFIVLFKNTYNILIYLKILHNLC